MAGTEKTGNVLAKKLLESFGLTDKSKRPISFAFSSKTVPTNWAAYTFDLEWEFYYIIVPGSSLSQIRSFASGIGKENFGIVAALDDQVILVLKRSKKDDDGPLLVPLRKEEDLERVSGAIKKFNFVSDVLTAHSSLSSLVDLLKAGAERHFVNRGLFSTYFLKERLRDSLAKRGRNQSKEIDALLSKFGGEFPVTADSVIKVLEALTYNTETEITASKHAYQEIILRSYGRKLDTCCIVAPVESLDIKSGDKAAPSYQAVAALKHYGWVILTNGRLWRLYSARVSSASTNYFEVDMDNISISTDPRLIYFVSLFSALSFSVREGVSDVELVYDEGTKHAQEIEADLRQKVFDGDLFLNLVKSVLSHSSQKTYTQEELDKAKAIALKLLYRLLFVLYAESRNLLPVENTKYNDYSLENLRLKLDAFDKKPDEKTVWKKLNRLFEMISLGDSEANLPQYDGDLFANDEQLDSIAVKNCFIVPALRDLMEIGGRGIDYQNLGVRHLGSLYEALLEYSVRQAKQPLVIFKDEILDAKFAEDLKQKPLGFIEKGDLYLTAKGLARKGTGSYYTPDAIVAFLVSKGLEPHFKKREEQFKTDLANLPPESTSQDLELEKKCSEDLLGIKAVDPAMGSGHFLVAVVNEITRWIIDLLRQYPYAPLVREIEEFRASIIEAQRKKGIRLDEDLLTDTVILKRMVMKRCVYGVDINPLAVELSKVSLWLDSFTIGTPLTFLDHHIRCGDSLIGLWLESIAPKVFETTLDKWTGTVSNAGENILEAVIMPADLTVKQVTKSREAYEAVRAKTKSFSILLDIFCADIINPELGKKLPNNLSLIEETSRTTSKKPKWWAFVEETSRLSEKYRFFHWELEFPDAFSEKDKGFDLIVMNPPWDVIIPEDDDFFATYYPKIRRIKDKTEKQKIINDLLKKAEINQAYEKYKELIEKRNEFYLNSGMYAKRGREHANMWKLFMEKAFSLPKQDSGTIAVVIPSSIVTDHGAKELRQELFKNNIRIQYEFENSNGIFQDVHRSFKFSLLIVDMTHIPSQSFSAAFYLHDLQSLMSKAEQEKFVTISIDLVKKCSPESLCIPEIRNKTDFAVFERLYDLNPLLNDKSKGWTIGLLQEELNRTRDSNLFKPSGVGWPLFEGKNFHQFTPDYEKPNYSVLEEAGLHRTESRKIYQSINKKIHRMPRLAYRMVASSTNVRTMVACILPPKSFCPNSATLVFPMKGEKIISNDEEYYSLLSYLAGIFNSFVFDFLIRTRVTMNLNYFYVLETPVPCSFKGTLANDICQISAKLSSQDNRFEQLAEALRLKTSSIDMRQRIELTAKLNALVAKHYGLNRQEFQIVLNSFDSFEEDKELVNMKEAQWADTLIRKFNGEVRKRVLPFFDQLSNETNKV